MVLLNQRISKIQNHATWIQIVLLFIIKLKMFIKIADDVEKIFDTSDYEANRTFRTHKIKKVIGLMKDELGGKIMT